MQLSEVVDGDFFESLADFSFGDPYGSNVPLSLHTLNNFLCFFSEARLPRIFITTDKVLELFQLCKAAIRPFMLISHNGDFNFQPSHERLRPDLVVKWYSQNLNMPNSRNTITIPIGLERRRWFPEMKKQESLLELAAVAPAPTELLYLNFNPLTNPAKRSWIADYFATKSFVRMRLAGNGADYRSYLSEIAASQYVLCPDGNGIDCHRTWEVLTMNRFPILERCACHIANYSDLPVLFVDSFREVTKELLESNIEVLKKKINPHRLTQAYFRTLIQDN